jgi:hypothetical protein
VQDLYAWKGEPLYMDIRRSERLCGVESGGSLAWLRSYPRGLLSLVAETQVARISVAELEAEEAGA